MINVLFLCLVLNQQGLNIYPVYFYPLDLLIASHPLVCLSKKSQGVPVMPSGVIMPMRRLGMVWDKERPKQQQGSFG